MTTVELALDAKDNAAKKFKTTFYSARDRGTTIELEVLLVAVKSDIVEWLFRSGDAAGLKLQLVDGKEGVRDDY